MKTLWFSVSLWLKCRRKLLPLRHGNHTESRRDERAYLLGPSTFTNLFIKTIWLALLFATGFALWHFLPESIRSEFTPTAYAATLTVNSADDHNDGVCNAADCTLREALNAANAGDTISFNIAGSGVHTINATSGFNITKTVTVDGTTQPGFAGAPLIELNGAGAGAGVNGLSVNAPNVIIKGLIVNRFSGYGINFDSFGNSSVQGCYIGPNAAGTAASANGTGGIRINAGGVTIGGATAEARNVISGNAKDGIDVLVGASTIQGNFIGTNAVGTAGVENRGDGILLNSGTGNLIGGTTSSARNVITDNGGSGIKITAGNATVQGNFIGLFSDGRQDGDEGNWLAGINITGGSATIGGTAAGAGNIIAGNVVLDPHSPPEQGARIYIHGGTGSLVQGNLLGPHAFSNAGVLIDGAANNVIGGTDPAARNIISANNYAIQIANPGATNNLVQGNLIRHNLGGVYISGANNSVGGTNAGAGNEISFNSDTGVQIGSGTGNAILGNSIFSNTNLVPWYGALGIALGPTGNASPNDSCDSDTGPNNLQNFPVITSATTTSTTTTIQGTLNGTPSTQFRIEFFANSDCDLSGNGEGQTFLGFTNTTTDASCNATFSFSVPNASLTGPIITATATDANNNTSEFSACATPMGALPTIQFSAPSYTIGEGDKHLDIPVTRTGDTSVTASVSFATSDQAGTQNCSVSVGFASSRCDYEPRLVTVKFAPGETSKMISVLINDDSYREASETFNVRLTNGVGAFVGAPSEATVTIIDNDLANGPNPIDAPGIFVRAHYSDFLNRDPDASGFDFWTNQITSCGFDQACIQLKRINVSAAFFLSTEFQQSGYFVERTYKAAFGDTTSTSRLGGERIISVPRVGLDEFLRDTQQLQQGVVVGQNGWEIVLENNKRAFVLDFVQRPQFPAAFPTFLTPAQFVAQLFANAKFTPSNADRNAAIAEFGSATNSSDVEARSRALRDVSDHPILIQQEFNRAFVLMQYFGYLRRNPGDPPDSDYTGYDFWLTKLNQFNEDFQKSEMVKAFISSSEYRSRFGP